MNNYKMENKMKLKSVLLCSVSALFMLACGCATMTGETSVNVEPWGEAQDGTPVKLYTLVNGNGMTVRISNYGAIIQSLTAADRDGVYEDVVLGYDDVAGYIKETPYFGATIGRYGNRIAKGKFTLDGQEYTLAKNNNGLNHLHGGVKGFDKVMWDAVPEVGKKTVSLKMHYSSKDGDEGFPGNLEVDVVFTLNNKDELMIEYTATTDKATPVNLTNHSYFNLTADPSQTILGHELWMNADRFVSIDSESIPLGPLDPVAGTPFDFTTAEKIGRGITEDNQQLKNGIGYDHCWVFSESDGSLTLQVSLYEAESGRLLEILTEEPSVQFYSGNFLDGSLIGKGGVVYNHRVGLCLEPEHYPDSPNQPAYPSTILRPGETYETKSVYRFSAK